MKLRKILNKFPGLDLKTLALLVLPIYWAIILIATFSLVELKVTKANKIKFLPHQIAFHIRHPDNTFILVSRLTAGGSKLFEKDQVYLYRGKRIQELVACGLKLDACRSGLDDCINHLVRLGA